MSLTKRDEKKIEEIMSRQIIDAISELVIPAIDRVYKELRDFKTDTKRNFADVERQINDLKLDTPSNRKFLAHEDRIHKLEYELGFA